MTIRVEVEGGKFAVILDANGIATAERHGAPWPAYADGVPNLAVSLAVELYEAREELTKARQSRDILAGELEAERARHGATRRTLDVLGHAALSLYSAGKWELTRGAIFKAAQTRLWEDLRDALGLPAGTATAAGFGARGASHRCPACDDAMECDCNPPVIGRASLEVVR